jgi:hypothetical protein
MAKPTLPDKELAARRDIIAKLEDPDASLSYWQRLCAAAVLADAWLTKADRRQRLLGSLVYLIDRVKPGLSRLKEAERDKAFDMLAHAYGHASGPAFKQWLKREKAARKRRWADDPIFAEAVCASLKDAEPIEPKRRRGTKAR